MTAEGPRDMPMWTSRIGILCWKPSHIMKRNTWDVLYESIWQQRKIKIHAVVVVAVVEGTQTELKGIGEGATLIQMVVAVLVEIPTEGVDLETEIVVDSVIEAQVELTETGGLVVVSQTGATGGLVIETGIEATLATEIEDLAIVIEEALVATVIEGLEVIGIETEVLEVTGTEGFLTEIGEASAATGTGALEETETGALVGIGTEIGIVASVVRGQAGVMASTGTAGTEMMEVALAQEVAAAVVVVVLMIVLVEEEMKAEEMKEDEMKAEEMTLVEGAVMIILSESSQVEMVVQSTKTALKDDRC